MICNVNISSKASALAATALLCLYSFFSILGVIALPHTMHGHTMMHDCPYAVGAQALCPTAIDHLSSWQQFMRALAPALSTLLLLVLPVVFVVILSNSFFYTAIRQRYREVPRLLQLLFSSGILHPKAP